MTKCAKFLLIAGLISLLAAGLSGCKKKELASGEDTEAAYPFSWQEEEKGDILVTFSGALPDGAEWTADSDTPDTAGAAVEEVGKIRLTPGQEGTAVVTVTFTTLAVPVQAGARTYFSLLVDENGHMSLTASAQESFEGFALGADSDCPVFYVKNDGSATVYLSGASGWTDYSRVGSFLLTGFTGDGDYTRTDLIPVSDGSGVLTLNNSEMNISLTLTFESQGGNLTIFSAEKGDFLEAEEESLSEEDQAFREAYENAADDEERSQLIKEQQERLLDECIEDTGISLSEEDRQEILDSLNHLMKGGE